MGVKDYNGTWEWERGGGGGGVFSSISRYFKMADMRAEQRHLKCVGL